MTTVTIDHVLTPPPPPYPANTSTISPPPLAVTSLEKVPYFPHHIEQGVYLSKSSPPLLGFDDRSIRCAFVRKVFAIVSLQLLVVAVMCSIGTFNQRFRQFVKTDPNAGLHYFGSLILLIVVYCVLMCGKCIRRTFPFNLLATGILTLSLGYMAMIITAHHNFVSIAIALITAFVCCLAVIIYACQTRYDLTSTVGALTFICFSLLLFCISAAILYHTKYSMLHSVYAFFMALLFMAYLAWDVQTMMGGRRYTISPEDYIMAAVQLFIDIVYIFLIMLGITSD